MKRSLSGFTLIELMIVVSIIGIITAIAIPAMLRARMAANETSAAAECKNIITAHNTFRRTDWDSDGVLEYAYWIDDLHLTGGKRPELTNRATCKARYGGSWLGTTVPHQGYVNLEHSGYYVGASFRNRSIFQGGRLVVVNCGAHVFPTAYGLSGMHCFAADEAGIVWRKDAASDFYFTTNAFARPLGDAAWMTANGWSPAE